MGVGKYGLLAIGVLAVAVLAGALLFHFVETDAGTVIIPKENMTLAYTVISVDDFLDEWNGMAAYERLQDDGPLSYLKKELTKRHIIGPVSQ
jgi:hypothetical protein